MSLPPDPEGFAAPRHNALTSTPSGLRAADGSLVVDVSVVIVNFNSGEYLRGCLDSLDGGCAGFNWDAVVVDNASSDGSEQAAIGHDRRVCLVRSAANLGFAQAANDGVRATTGRLVLLLNPDGRLTEGAVAPLAAELASHPECAIVAPDVVNEDGSPQGNARRDPTWLTGLFGRSGLARRFFPDSRLVAQNVVRADALPEGAVSCEVDWVSGSCLLARRDALTRIGGFDVGYFLYWEDADLCRRIRGDGRSVRYRPDPVRRVVHTQGRSSSTAPDLAVRAFHDSAYRYYSTHVARSPWNPSRWLAWAVLGLRSAAVRAMRPASPAEAHRAGR